MRLPPDSARSRVRGFLLGTAIGDAMGVALEGRPPLSGVPLGTFWEGFLPIPDDPGTPPGRTSDDTQLVVLAMLSLQPPGDFDAGDLAELLCREMRKRRTDGWGGATIRAVGGMVYEGLSWQESGCPEGVAGNGAAMRAGPLGLWPWASEEDMISAVLAASRVTHRDQDACAGAVAVAAAHRYVSRCDEFEVEGMTEAILRCVSPLSMRVRDLLEFALTTTDGDMVMSRLSELGDATRNPETGRRGISGYVLPSVAAALMFFARHPSDPETSLGRAMLAGGDTDTVGSIVGGLTGTLNGVEIWPPHLLSNVRHSDRLLAIADSFAAALSS